MQRLAALGKQTPCVRDVQAELRARSSRLVASSGIISLARRRGLDDGVALSYGKTAGKRVHDHVRLTSHFGHAVTSRLFSKVYPDDAGMS